MANSDAPRGLTPIRHKSGAPYNNAVTMMYINSSYATALFRGDPVLIVAGGSNSELITVPSGGKFPPGTLQEIEVAAAGGYISGVIVSFAIDPDDLSKTYSPASTESVAYVCTDPDVLFAIQEVSGGTALTNADIGLNASFVAGSGSTITGQSGFELDNSTESTTLDLDLKIRALLNVENNAIGEHAQYLVQINKHSFASGVGTAGV